MTPMGLTHEQHELQQAAHAMGIGSLLRLALLIQRYGPSLRAAAEEAQAVAARHGPNLIAFVRELESILEPSTMGAFAMAKKTALTEHDEFLLDTICPPLMAAESSGAESNRDMAKSAVLAGVPWALLFSWLVQYGPLFWAKLKELIDEWRKENPAPA